MRTKQVKLKTIRLPQKDLQLNDAQEHLRQINIQLCDLCISVTNVRLRFFHDTYIDGDDREQDQFFIEVWYETELTAEDIEEEKEFLKIRAAEREAQDRIQFDKMKKRYGWT